MRLVDVGGGTGAFTAMLHGAAGLRTPALVVDPSQSMLDAAGAHTGVLETLCLGATEFATRSEVYDRCLLKEMIHHIPAEELGAFFAGMASQLGPGGRALIMTRCAAARGGGRGARSDWCARRPHSPEYPYFEAAMDVWKSQQPEVRPAAAALPRPAAERGAARILHGAAQRRRAQDGGAGDRFSNVGGQGAVEARSAEPLLVQLLRHLL